MLIKAKTFFIQSDESVAKSSCMI